MLSLWAGACVAVLYLYRKNTTIQGQYKESENDTGKVPLQTWHEILSDRRNKGKTLTQIYDRNLNGSGLQTSNIKAKYVFTALSPDLIFSS